MMMIFQNSIQIPCLFIESLMAVYKGNNNVKISCLFIESLMADIDCFI